MKYIGMDAHSSNCVLSVMDGAGVELDSVKIATNGRLLVNYLKSIEGKKKLTFEECELSHWLYEVLRHEVDELIVCNPVANREYKQAKTDKLDARRLAKLLRGGFLVPVYHDGSEREKFRVLVSGYQSLVGEAVRLKNRYKALFRREGKTRRGEAMYNDESLLADLERSDLRFVGQRLYGLIERMEEERQKYLEEIAVVGKGFREIRRLKTIPGIGDIQSAKIVSQVIDPARFKDKYHYWSYCGLVRHPKESGGRSYGSKKVHGNRILKCVYKMAGHSALTGENGLRRYYDRRASRSQRLPQDRGNQPERLETGSELR
jgi:transposase